MTYFTSSRGKVGQAAENIIVSPERAPKCCPGMVPCPGIILEQLQSCPSATFWLFSGTAAVSTGQCSPCHSYTGGLQGAREECGALHRFSSCTQHMFSCMNCFFNTPTASVSFSQQERKATKKAREP